MSGFTRSKAFFKKNPPRAKKADKKNATVGTVRRMLKNAVEYKHKDINIVNTVDTALGQQYDLCEISQGDGLSERIGKRITIKSIEYRFTFQRALGAVVPSDTYNVLRFIIFKWKQDDSILGAGVPVMSDVLTQQSVLTAFPPLAPPVFQNKRVRILHDFMYRVDAAAQNVAMWKKKHVYKTGHVVEFNDATNDGYNKLYLSIIGDSTAEPDPTIQGIMRVTYSDA